MSADNDSLTRGPDATVERVLADYGLDVETWAGDAFESDVERLLLALLLEQQGTESIQQAEIETIASQNSRQQGNPDYLSRSVTATNEPNEIDLEFQASTLVARGFSDVVYVAFESPNSSDLRIRLDPNDGDEPFALSPGDSFEFGSVYYGRPDGSTDTSFTLEVFE